MKNQFLFVFKINTTWYTWRSLSTRTVSSELKGRRLYTLCYTCFRGCQLFHFSLSVMMVQIVSELLLIFRPDRRFTCGPYAERRSNKNFKDSVWHTVVRHTQCIMPDEKTSKLHPHSSAQHFNSYQLCDSLSCGPYFIPVACPLL